MPDTSQPVIQLKFASLEKIAQVAEHLNYWLNLPLPAQVLENPEHKQKYETLAGIKAVFDACLQSHSTQTVGEKGFDAKVQFGKGGSITQDPPPQS